MPETGRFSGMSQVGSETEARMSIHSRFASDSPGEWSGQGRDRMLPSGLGELNRERDRHVSLEVKASRVKVIGKTPGKLSGPRLLLLHRPLELETRINAHPM